MERAGGEERGADGDAVVHAGGVLVWKRRAQVVLKSRQAVVPEEEGAIVLGYGKHAEEREFKGDNIAVGGSKGALRSIYPSLVLCGPRSSIMAKPD